MLILVAVTIQVATNGNLFKHAGNAVKQTKNAVLQENYLLEGKIQVGGVSYNSIEEYVSFQLGAEDEEEATSTYRHTITFSDSTFGANQAVHIEVINNDATDYTGISMGNFGTAFSPCEVEFLDSAVFEGFETDPDMPPMLRARGFCWGESLLLFLLSRRGILSTSSRESGRFLYIPKYAYNFRHCGANNSIERKQT